MKSFLIDTGSDVRLEIDECVRALVVKHLLPFPQPLRRHSKRPVEFTGSVFPGDHRSKLHYLIVVVIATQSREKFVVDVFACDRHAICKFQRDAFRIGVQRVSCIMVKRVNLLCRDSQTAADRSVDVLSKFTAVQESHPPVHQSFQFVGDQS